MGKTKKKKNNKAKKNIPTNQKQQKNNQKNTANNNVKAITPIIAKEEQKIQPPKKEETVKRVIEESEIKNVFSLKDKINSMDRSKLAYIVFATAITVLLVILAVLLLCGVFATDELKAATVVYYGRNESENTVSVISSDEEAQKDYVKGTKASGYTGRFDFYAQTEINLNDDGDLAPLSISNPTYNDCTIIVTITNGDGKVLYRSLGIKPGQYINSVSFNNGLNYGENNLKIYVTAFEGDGGKNGRSFKRIGNQFVDLKVNVGTEYNSSMLEEIKPATTEKTTVSENTTVKK